MVRPLIVPETAQQVVDMLFTDFEGRLLELFSDYPKDEVLSQLDEDAETLWKASELSDDPDDKEMIIELIGVTNRLRLEALAL